MSQSDMALAREMARERDERFEQLKRSEAEADRYRVALRAITIHRPYVPEMHPGWQRCVDIATEALSHV